MHLSKKTYRVRLSGTLAEDIRLMRLNSKLKRSLEQRLQEGKPIAKYDLIQKRAYLEYSNGRIVYIDKKT